MSHTHVRFFSKVDFFGPIQKHMKTRCWVWKGATGKSNTNRYGKFYVSPGKIQNAHRWAYEDLHGKPPKGKEVGHRCDNKLCVRHLEAVTHRKNMRDAVARGRVKRGSESPHHQLTEEDVVKIRNFHKRLKTPQPELAKLFGVQVGAIWKIINKRNWKHC